MSKQDRGGVRTAAELERKYDFAGMKKATKMNTIGLSKTNKEMEDFVNQTLGSIENIQNQIDGKVDTYYYSGVPSLSNLPAAEWNEEDYPAHIGDLYYDQDTGTAYKFTKLNSVFQWLEVDDDKVAEALAIANAAKDTADAKRRIFVAKPSPPYEEGDLWLYNKEIYVCVKKKLKTESYAENDFALATDYANNSKVNEVESKLDEQITVIEYLRSNSIFTENFEAEAAKIGLLKADEAEIKFASIEKLEAQEGEFAKISAKVADIEEAYLDEAAVETLVAGKGYLDEANINTLLAAKGYLVSADIEDLNTKVADIGALMFGSASGSSLTTEFSNAVIGLIGDATISSAKIIDLDAGKIKSGTLDTSLVTVKSKDGNLQISGDVILVKDANRTRVQLGKDANGDYNIYVVDADGNVMFDATGIHSDAIKSPIIENAMVADDANISASKLNIDSLFTEINKSSKTIKSTKIYLDDKEQTLDVAFSSVTNTVTGLGNTVSSQGTAISAIQGQITSKIWEQDIETVTDALGNRITTQENNFSTLNSTVSGISATVQQHTNQIAEKADGSTVTTLTENYTKLSKSVDGISETVASHTSQIQEKADGSVVEEVSGKVTSVTKDLDGFKTEVSSTYVTNDGLESKLVVLKSSIAETADGLHTEVLRIDDLGERMTTAEQNALGFSARIYNNETEISKVKTIADDAATTATNFLRFGEDGVIFGNLTDEVLTTYVLVESTGVNVKESGTALARFSKNKIQLGMDSSASVIEFCSAKGKVSYGPNRFDSGDQFTFVSDRVTLMGDTDVNLFAGNHNEFTNGKASQLMMKDGRIWLAGAVYANGAETIGSLEITPTEINATKKFTVGSASMDTNGYVTGTWLRSTANIALGSAATTFAVVSGGWIYTRTASQVLNDIGAETAGSAANALTIAKDYTEGRIALITCDAIGAEAYGSAADALATAKAYTEEKVSGITYDSIGAARAGHTHSEYALSSHKHQSIWNTAETYAVYVSSTGNFLRNTDANQCLGSETTRWKTAYLTSAASVSSDRRLKEDFSTDMDKYISLIDRVLPTSFYRTDEDVATRKRHTGYIAQDFEKALAEVGLSERDFNVLDKYVDEFGNVSYGLCQEELISILHAKMNRDTSKLTENLELFKAETSCKFIETRHEIELLKAENQSLRGEVALLKEKIDTLTAA